MRWLKKHTEEITKVLSIASEPVVVTSFEEQKRFLKTWRDSFKDEKTFRVDFGELISYLQHSNFGKPRPHLRVRVENRGANFKSYDCIWANIHFDENDRLVLAVNSARKEWLLNDRHQIFLYVEKILAFFEEKNKEGLKQEKIKGLKTKSIVAKLAEIAREDGFEYDHRESTRSVSLFVKLPKEQQLEIKVHYSSFQEVMQQVRPIIKSVRELAESGVHFQISKAGYRNWNKPK